MQNKLPDQAYREIKFKISLRFIKILKRMIVISLWGLVAWFLFFILDNLTAKPGSYREKRSMALSGIIESNIYKKFGAEMLAGPSKCNNYNTAYDCREKYSGATVAQRAAACAAIKAGTYLKQPLKDCLWIGANNTKKNTRDDRILIVADAQLAYYYPEAFHTLIEIASKPCNYIGAEGVGEKERKILKCDDRFTHREKIRINFLDGFLSKERERAGTLNDLGILAFFVEIQRED